MNKKIAITSEYFGKFSDVGEKILLDSGFELIKNHRQKNLNEDEVIALVGQADGIICDLEPITQKVMDSAPNLSVISRRGVGTDSVDVSYAKMKNITVTRTLGVVEKPVAELVMSYMLMINRKIAASNDAMKDGQWVKFLGNSLDGKVLGILGMGSIGQEVARKAKAFDMNLVYYDTKRNEKVEERFNAEFVSFETLVACSDVISIHVPLLDQTRNLIDYWAMRKMEKSPILINTARGPVINEKDLCRGLEEGLISYAAIDVYDEEPNTESPLRNYKNVILTPHVGTFTKEVFVRMDVVAAHNVVKHFNV